LPKLKTPFPAKTAQKKGGLLAIFGLLRVKRGYLAVFIHSAPFNGTEFFTEYK
jgi:hypothetical protein